MFAAEASAEESASDTLETPSLLNRRALETISFLLSHQLISYSFHHHIMFISNDLFLILLLFLLSPSLLCCCLPNSSSSSLHCRFLG